MNELKNCMGKLIVLNLIFSIIFLNNLSAQTGYYDAPYIRYEADLGTLVNATATTKSYSQSTLQSEASEQVCVNLSNAGASVSWTVSANGDGLVVRYSVPDGESGVLEVFADNVSVGTLTLTSYYSWEYLWSNGDPNNNGITNQNPKMRFDEVRMKLPAKILSGGNLKLLRQSGNIHIDFAELEDVPAAVTSSAGNVIYSGNGSDLQNVINTNGGKTIYIPAGVYNVNRELYFGVANTTLKGAGMWYTQIHFTDTDPSDGGRGGLTANVAGISYSGLYLTTARNSRTNSYKAINGVYTSTSTITDIWAEHFECGAWIAQYNNGPANADGFTVSNCRFRNNYADGINLCKGTKNTVVEHCSFRNNGDDDMAIWSQSGMECQNNTYRYNTSENCWRAAGCAIYGGYNNTAHHLLIKDNLEVGIRVNNSFSGAGFNAAGMHEFSDITILRCGTFNDLYNSPVGAIDIACTNINGTRINNVKLANINITDSKNDAIYIRRQSGEGFYNLVFENITINGTGKEYPNNNINNLNWGRGYGILFVGNPSGNGTYCNITYANRGGNATSNVNSAQIGTFSWTAVTGCVTGSSTTITSANTFGVCNNPITLSASSVAPSGNTVSYVEFFVDNVSIGQDNTAAYTMQWNNAVAGSYQIKAISHYSPSNTTAVSNIQSVTVADGIYTTATIPVIDGIEEPLWNNYAPFSLNLMPVGSVSGAADLSATYQVMRDANNLYVLVNVTDEDLRNDSPENYNDDAIELFIDMGNNKNGTYAANDFSFTFAVNDATVYESKHNATTGVTFFQGSKTGGYIMEIQIPWSTLLGAPAAGDFMGVDVHVNDDDGGGARDAKKSWKDGTDNAWQSTSVLGTLQVAACTNPLITSTFTFAGEAEEYNFYPNPFISSGNLKLPSGDNFVVSISDLNGKLIWSKSLSGSATHSIGDNIPTGVYVLDVFDGIEKRTVRLVKL